MLVSLFKLHFFMAGQSRGSERALRYNPAGTARIVAARHEYLASSLACGEILIGSTGLLLTVLRRHLNCAARLQWSDVG